MGRRKRRDEAVRGSPERIELQKEIIVSGPRAHSSSRQSSSKSFLSRNPDQNSDGSSLEESKICGSKPTVIFGILGFCLVQILVVVSSAICVCQRSKEKSASSETSPSYRPSDFYYARPSTVFSTLRSLRTNLRD